MATAVLPNPKPSAPFHRSPRVAASSPIPSSSSSHSPDSPAPSPEPSTKAFRRLKSSLEQSIRTATRSKKAPPPVDEFATLTAKGKGKAKDEPPPPQEKEREKMGMLRRVTFRRRESATPSPNPPTNQGRVAGVTSFITPSMRLASMSSPALHLSSQALPSPKSQPAVPLSSSSNTDGLVSPTRQRSSKPSLQLNTHAQHSAASKEPSTRHRSSSKSNAPVPPSPSSPSLPLHGSSTPTRPRKDRDRDTPDTPSPRGNGHLARGTSLRPSPITPRAAPSSALRPRSPSAATRSTQVTPPRGLTSASATHLPLTSSPSPPPTPTRRRPSLDPSKRPSLDAPRRPSIDATPRRSSRDSPIGLRRNESPSPSPVIRPRAISPTQRSYAQNRHFNISSGSLVLSNNHPPPTPTRGEDATPRDLIRTATTLICKQVQKPPHHMCRTEQGIRDWEEVEVRTRNLVRLEKGWAKGVASTARRSSVDVTSSGLSGEDKERKLFCEALRDGYVLCQLMNKLRQSSIVRPDAREDGVVRTANVTKFLAACASYGLPSEDLFLRDDLMEITNNKDAAVRVAKTVIKLVAFSEESEEDRIRERQKGKWIRGGGMSPSHSHSQSSGGGQLSSSASTSGSRSPYGTIGSISSRGSASTPNLLAAHQIYQPPSSPTRKRWSPPEDMTPLRSSSPENSVHGSGSGSGSTVADATAREASRSKLVINSQKGAKVVRGRGTYEFEEEETGEEDEDAGEEAEFKTAPVPMMGPPPPPRSPLRKPSMKRVEDASGLALANSRVTSSSPNKTPVTAAVTPTKRRVSASASSTSGGLTASPSISTSGTVAVPTSPSLRDSIADSTRASIGDASIRDELILPSTSRPGHGYGHPPHPGSPGLGSGLSQQRMQMRQSIASSALSVAVSEAETTLTSAKSSLLDGGRSSSLFGGGQSAGNGYGYGYSGSTGNGNGNGSHHKYGTIRTVTTDFTSEAPSISRTEGSAMSEELEAMLAMKRRVSGDSLGNSIGNGNGNGHGKYSRERKLSEAPLLDLSRVAEEAEETVSSKGQRGAYTKRAPMVLQGRSRSQEQNIFPPPTGDKPTAVYLRKGKWPDDFLDAFQAPVNPASSSAPISSSSQPQNKTQPQSIPAKSQHHHQRHPYLQDREESPSPSPSTPVSISPPRKLAIVSRRVSGEGVGDGPYAQLPRRPTHRPRHSIDSPVGVGGGNGGLNGNVGGSVLLPKESILRREASPDSASVSSSGRVVIRRNSTKPGVGSTSANSGVSGRMAKGSNGLEDPPSSAGSVPFPRSISASGDPSPRSSFGENVGEQPRMVRGRFQSDVEGSARRKARPSSYDELGGRPQRSRFESMVNLGVASGTTSASDLMSRDSIDGSAVRMRLVVREDGKPPTHFQLGNCIGRGQFGSVYRALNLNTGQMVAVKRIRLEGLKEEEVTTLMREVDLVKSLSHPSIVKYEGMARDDDTLSIVLEYAENGSLGQTLKSFGKLNEKLVASYVVKILEGLHYLHTSDVVHCDLKAANILTTKNGNVKLSDFGVSLNLRAMEREIKDVAGTPNWMAPEVIELKGASTKSDIWSLGCTVIELLTGRPPYADIANSMSVMFRIVEDEMPPMPEGCSELLKDFLEQCFHKDPTRRPDAETLCEHPWLKNNWVALKELRPQDSIPFLRRVSTDLHKSDAVRYLAQMDLPDTPISGSPMRDSPMGRRTSASSVRPVEPDFLPREHTFVKTTFSKPMVCRVCLANVKKSAVLCSQCSLISHAKCAINAPPTCDLRAQLLLYAQYAEKGNPASAYSNPAEGLDVGQNVAMSDVPFVEHNTPRTSVDSPQPPLLASSNAVDHPPTAFKFMAAFKRSRSNLSPEPAAASASSSPVPTPPSKDSDDAPAKRRVLQRRSDRPQSMTSNSTTLSSMRSAATAAESFSSRQNTGPRSHISGGAESDKSKRPASEGGLLDKSRSNKAAPSGRLENTTTTKTRTTHNDLHDDIHTNNLPGALPIDPRNRNKKQKNNKSPSSSSCNLQ
ncbi:Cytokinesis protein sepH [Psilocybe cubensis]|nr:Cytokinesis protein sepH [Psilocybe cubensis]KAH9479372.1 Cytokinesis protein sepH [Psilocybe cubensis]